MEVFFPSSNLLHSYKGFILEITKDTHILRSSVFIQKLVLENPLIIIQLIMLNQKLIKTEFSQERTLIECTKRPPANEKVSVSLEECGLNQ